MDELKACPFCGSSNTTLDYYEISCPQELGTIVVCNDCGASAKSIVDWNQRPLEDALNARIAELEAKTEQSVGEYWVTKLDILQDQYDALEKDYADVCQKRLEAADVFSRQIIELESENAKLEAERRWIPVSEKPTKSDWYLIMYQGYGVPVAGYYHVDGGWLSDIPDCWMPLPEPPEVKE